MKIAVRIRIPTRIAKGHPCPGRSFGREACGWGRGEAHALVDVSRPWPQIFSLTPRPTPPALRRAGCHTESFTSGFVSHEFSASEGLGVPRVTPRKVARLTACTPGGRASAVGWSTRGRLRRHFAQGSHTQADGRPTIHPFVVTSPNGVPPGSAVVVALCSAAFCFGSQNSACGCPQLPILALHNVVWGRGCRRTRRGGKLQKEESDFEGLGKARTACFAHAARDGFSSRPTSRLPGRHRVHALAQGTGCARRRLAPSGLAHGSLLPLGRLRRWLIRTSVWSRSQAAGGLRQARLGKYCPNPGSGSRGSWVRWGL